MVRLILTTLALLVLVWGLFTSAHDYACKNDSTHAIHSGLEEQPGPQDSDPCHRGICNFGHCQHMSVTAAIFAVTNRVIPFTLEIPYVSEAGKYFARRLERPPILDLATISRV